MMLAMAGEALARNGGRGETGRAGGLKVLEGAGAVSKADRMGSKFWPLVRAGAGGGGWD